MPLFGHSDSAAMSSTLLLALVATIAAVARGDDLPPLHKLPDVAYAYATPSEPGYFPTELVRVPVVDVKEETHNSKVITFGLPDDASLDLPVSSALLMHVPPAHDMDDDAAEGKKKKVKVGTVVFRANEARSQKERPKCPRAEMDATRVL